MNKNKSSLLGAGDSFLLFPLPLFGEKEDASQPHFLQMLCKGGRERDSERE